VDLWAAYDAIACPTRVIRGAKSDVLAADTAQEMTRRGPKAELRMVAECGHAPLLDVPHQMALVTEFLDR
jgi:pimeloyl-ACP methyl ester carboxylesterase